MIRWRALGLAALCLLAVACVPVDTPKREQEGLFSEGTVDDAARAVSFHVLRPTYLPTGAQLVAVEYSIRDEAPWVVQRFREQDRYFYIKSEPLPPDLNPARDATALVKGRWLDLSARYGADGGIGEWLLYYPLDGVLHVVAGEIPAEELVKVAAGAH